MRKTAEEYENMCREMVGKRYYHITVLEYLGVHKLPELCHGFRMVRVRCDCGAEFEAPAARIRDGSCRFCAECRKPYERKSSTLCWRCAKSTNYHLCQWAEGIPRDDWEAEPRIVDGAQTWQVVSCPEFEAG